MDTMRPHTRPSGATGSELETTESAVQLPVPEPPELLRASSATRRPYRKPVPELRGQIKPSLLGSPPLPP